MTILPCTLEQLLSLHVQHIFLLGGSWRRCVKIFTNFIEGREEFTKLFWWVRKYSSVLIYHSRLTLMTASAYAQKVSPVIIVRLFSTFLNIMYNHCSKVTPQIHHQLLFVFLFVKRLQCRKKFFLYSRQSKIIYMNLTRKYYLISLPPFPEYCMVLNQIGNLHLRY